MTTKTKKVTLPTVEELRKEEELRLYVALGNVEPGTDAYTKILAQIASLDAHARAVELKESDQQHDNLKHEQTVEVEYIKADAARNAEHIKASAAHRQSNLALAGKLVAIGGILIFEHSGHAIISKAFGLIRD